MNRAAQLLARCALDFTREEIEFLACRVAGVYCAAEPATAMQAEVAEFLNRSLGSLSKGYAQNVPPKWALQCGASLIAASVSIQLKAEGGVHTFSHKRMACRHAWDQARLDLALGEVDAAIVCSVASFEDPIVLDRQRKMGAGRAIKEGAVLAVLARSEKGRDIAFDHPRMSEDFFGIADPLIQNLRSPE